MVAYRPMNTNTCSFFPDFFVHFIDYYPATTQHVAMQPIALMRSPLVASRIVPCTLHRLACPTHTVYQASPVTHPFFRTQSASLKCYTTLFIPAYLKKGLDICESDELRFGLKSNLFAALIKAMQWEQAEKLSKDLIENTPSNMNYHNYAELLKHLTRYDEAVDWCKKLCF